MVHKLNYKRIFCILLCMAVVIFSTAELISPSALRQNNVSATANINESVRLPVIMYHHILKAQNKLGDYVISPLQFEQDLKLIKEKGYQTVSTSQIIDFVEKGDSLPEKPILITFDDGYESVYEYAYPLLKKYNMKAVVAIIGKYTDMFSNPNETKHINYSHLSWNELNEMQESGLVEIANHSYDMHSSGTSSRYGIRIKKGESSTDYRSALEKDIAFLNDKISSELNTDTKVFAYPFGALCKESRPILHDFGFKIILTCEEKVNTLSVGKYSDEKNKFIILKRFNRAHKYSSTSFFEKLEK